MKVTKRSTQEIVAAQRAVTALNSYQRALNEYNSTDARLQRAQAQSNATSGVKSTEDLQREIKDRKITMKEMAAADREHTGRVMKKRKHSDDRDNDGSDSDSDTDDDEIIAFGIPADSNKKAKQSTTKQTSSTDTQATAKPHHGGSSSSSSSSSAFCEC
jgi:hypothetical protein